MKLLQKTAVWTSILYLLMGLALLFWPGALLRAAGYAVGAVILLLGVGAVRLYFRSRDMLFFSGFSLAAGLLVLLHPFGMAVLTTRFIGGILAAESLLNLVCGLYAEWKMQRLWRESSQPEDEMLIQMRRLEEKFSRNRDSGPFSL